MTTLLITPELITPAARVAAPRRTENRRRPAGRPGTRTTGRSADRSGVGPLSPSLGTPVVSRTPSSRSASARTPSLTAVLPDARAGAGAGDVASTPRVAARLVARDTSRVGLAPLRTKPARLTTRGWVVLTLAFVGVLGGGLAVGQASVGAPSAPFIYATVTVTPGQTLWSIASVAAPEADPREVIDRIVAVNGLSSANDITAGDQLSVPTAG